MIHYITGDATDPIQTPAIIAHVCNDCGAWGRGFVLAVSARWKEPERAYREWHRNGPGFALGRVQLVQVDLEVYVANMVAQKGLRSAANPVPLRLDTLAECLSKVKRIATEKRASVHMPRIGCGLGGSSWDMVGRIVERGLEGVEVFVYDR